MGNVLQVGGLKLTLSWPRVRREDWFNFAKFWISKSMLDSGVRGVITYYVVYTFSGFTRALPFTFLGQASGGARATSTPQIESADILAAM